MASTTKKGQSIFAHSPSLQILWKCASQRRLVTKALLSSINFKNIYKDVLHYVKSKNRRRSPSALILDSHLMLGLVYVYSKTVILWHNDAEKLFKDAIVHRFFEFDEPIKSKSARKKDAPSAESQWQIEIDENLLPDERMLLERDFSIEIPREPTPPQAEEAADNLPPLPWDLPKPSHGKRITLLPDIEEPMPKFDLIDDRFGEPLPAPPTTVMDIDERYDRTFFRPASEDRSKELLRAPRGDRHMNAADRHPRPEDERTIDELRPMISELPPLEMPPMDTSPPRPLLPTRDRFSQDALAFLTSANNAYTIYGLMPTTTVLLGVNWLSSTVPTVPLIVIEEPTVIGVDDLAMQIDTLPLLDQQPPHDTQIPMVIDAQVPDIVMRSPRETDHFRVSKKKRNAPNALNKKRKDVALFAEIIDFDYATMGSIEDDEEEFEEGDHGRQPWMTLIGRNGAKRMSKLLEKADVAMTTMDDFRAIIEDIAAAAKVMSNPNAPDGLAQIRRTGQDLAIRRGQSSGLLPKTGTRSSSSIVPSAADRLSQLPPATSDADVLPPLGSGFDDFPLVPPGPTADLPQLASPQPPRRERQTATTTTPLELSTVWQDTQKLKAIDDIINVANGLDGGGLFDELLNRLGTTRTQAARLFGALLVLCGERRVTVYQEEPYGEIKIFLAKTQIDPSSKAKQTVPENEQQQYSPASIESDDDDHF